MRTFGKTICPSEVLPAKLKNSKSTMAKVRATAEKMRDENLIQIVQRGQVMHTHYSGPIRLRLPPPKKRFEYNQDFKKINFRKHSEFYAIGKGEQGVLLVEPYKSEILPYWKFRTPQIARVSAAKVYAMFLEYLILSDYVGADMSRKFLQMGVTRSRRYANHKSGKKYLGAVPADSKGKSGAHGRESL